MRLLVIGFALLVTFAFAQPLPTGAPEQAGFSSEGLARIDKFFAREIRKYYREQTSALVYGAMMELRTPAR